MMGKTHKSIGVSAGVSMVVYGALTNQPLYALGMLTAPIGAMWPDIDHDNSKIGAQRKKVMNNLRKVAWFMIALAFVIFTLNIKMQFTDMLSMLKISSLVVVSTSTYLAATSETLKKKFPFFSKHRGIMHTLFVPAVLIWVSIKIPNEVLSGLIVGLMLGYVSHLIADCLTVDGCPLAWPLSQECASFLKISTNTPAEKVAAIVLEGIFIVMGYFASQYDNLLLLVTVAIISAAAGKTVPKTLGKKFKKLQRNFVYSVVAPVLFIVVSGLVSNMLVKCACLCFGVGYSMFILSCMFKKK